MGHRWGQSFNLPQSHTSVGVNGSAKCWSWERLRDSWKRKDSEGGCLRLLSLALLYNQDEKKYRKEARSAETVKQDRRLQTCAAFKTKSEV